ncbi:MAG: TonB-dependent receptor, partial [Verrucomicrobiae bacterium]|nr:TonB-dependent receptor [Verrucomicrobiae bacterium]
YFGYGTSFNPSIEGLAGATTTNALQNLDTPPEESRSFELGTKWNVLRERLLLSLAVFQTDKTNARTPDAVDPTITVLTGEQRVRGVELGFGGSITEQWSLFGGYAYMDSEVVKSGTASEVGNDLANVPKNSLSLWTTYRLPLDITAGFGSQFVGARYNSTANTRQAPDYWLFNAMLGYQVTQNVHLQVNVFNLANKEYINGVGGGHYIPGAGRSAVLTAAFNF